MSVARFLLFILIGLNVHSWGIGLRKSGQRREGRIILNKGGMKSFFAKSSKIKSICCKKIFLKAFFLYQGSIGFPKQGYHMEVSGLNKRISGKAVNILQALKVPGKCFVRKGRHVIYFKSGDKIARLLAMLGAVKTLLRFEELRALRETKNRAMRQVNRESANMGKTAKASAGVQAMIAKLKLSGGWKRLPKTVREAAWYRANYPSAPLSDLAGKLAVTKSALNHRLRRLKGFLR